MKVATHSLGCLMLAACGHVAHDPDLHEVSPGIYAAATKDSLGVSPAIAADLSPYDIVGLGESVHLSGALQTFKAELTMGLVRDHGFRVVALESPWLLAQSFDPCTNGETSLGSSLGVVWQSLEVQAFAADLCEFNLNHPNDAVQVVGFDVQQPHEDGLSLREILLRVWPEEGPELWQRLSACDRVALGVGVALGERVDEEQAARCFAALDDTETLLYAPSSSALRNSDRWIARLNLIGIRSWESQIRFAPEYLNCQEGRSPCSFDSIRVRDEAMFEVFVALKEAWFSGEKVVVWSHNSHLARDTASASWPDRYSGFGSLLTEQVGGSYAAVAMVARDAMFLTTSGAQAEIRARPESVEEQLNDFSRDALWVDVSLASAPGGLLEGERLLNDRPLYLNDQFDFVLWQAHSPAASSL